MKNEIDIPRFNRIERGIANVQETIREIDGMTFHRRADLDISRLKGQARIVAASRLSEIKVHLEDISLERLTKLRDETPDREKFITQHTENLKKRIKEGRMSPAYKLLVSGDAQKQVSVPLKIDDVSRIYPIGSELSRALDARGISRSDFAKLIGVSVAKVQNMINGVVDPKTDERHYREIDTALGLRMADVINSFPLIEATDKKRGRGAPRAYHLRSRPF